MTANPGSNLPHDFDARRLRRLAAAQCDETLSDAEVGELEGTLAGSAAARTLYVKFMNVHAGLEWEITSHESVADLTPPSAMHGTEHGESRRIRWTQPLAAAALAGAALLATVLLAVTFALGSRRAGDRRVGAIEGGNDVAHRVDEALALTQVAAVTKLGPNAQWAVTPRPGASPRELRQTDVVCVTVGQIEVTFDSGAVVTLYAPAMLQAVSSMKARAIRGRLAATVNEEAHGFTIETPKATVVDLGTVFGVEVGDEGATDVVVFKGAVDLHYDRKTGARSHETPQRLTSGEAVQIDKRGTPSRIVSIFSDRFSREGDSPKDGAGSMRVISAVTDNIDRASGSWNYYEIVPGGMREDAKAFVDRVAHEWNGLDDGGVPQFLLGADYVKTFNNDKYSRDFELMVTLDRPCRLFVLIDDRVPPPAWLRSDFRDTGYNVGLDVGPFYRVEDGVLVDDRLPGIGAGVMVDEVISIWERRIDKPQVVRLGAIKADHRYINMYGIVATPITEN